MGVAIRTISSPIASQKGRAQKRPAAEHAAERMLQTRIGRHWNAFANITVDTVR
jgi:hypothetical protein